MSQKTINKQIQFRIDTAEHDMERYKNQALKFCDKGFNVLFILKLRGRDMKRIDMAELKMLNLIQSLGDEIKILQAPQKQGMRFTSRIRRKHN